MSRSKQLEHLKKVIKSADIQQLDALCKMNDKQLNHFLQATTQGEVSIDPATVRNLAVSEMVQASNAPLIQVQPSFRAPDARAIYTLTITRDSADLAFDLPVPIFGVLDKESTYKEVLASFLPSGCTVTVATSSTGKGLSFTYTIGGVSDIITIECNQVPYVNLLRASQTSLIKLSQTKMNIDDVANQSQFARSFSIIKNSLFGKFTEDSFTPNDFKSDLQNQNDIRIFTNTIEITPETSMVIPMIQDATGLSLTSFVEAYQTIR